MKRFVHLGINPIGAVAGAGQSAIWPPNFTIVLENYLSSVVVYNGWFRYGVQNYVVWTDADLNQLAQGVAALPNFGIVYVFATEFTLAQFGGWMPPLFWSWLQQPR
jgi:hypothetical protein